MLAQEFKEIPTDPVLVADFQGKFKLLRQALQKWWEPSLEWRARYKGIAVEVRKLQKQRA
jgi:hypothetical protein